MHRILVVEDSPIQAQALHTDLEAEGYQVESAPDGEHAYERFVTEDFDLVISDIVMPGISGYELCRKIKNHPTKGTLPVILLTSLSDPMDIIQGLECGANNFIPKPYDHSSLLNRIRSILESKAMRNQGKLRVGAEVLFLGKKLTINTDKEQILDLLISTFEDIVRTNQELRSAQVELRSAKGKVDQYARQLEGKVRSTEDKYRQLMDQASDAILIMNAQGRVLEANRSAETLLGEPASALIGNSFDRWVPPSERSRYQGYFERLMTSSTIRIDGMKVLRADGRSLTVDYAASLVEFDGDRILLTLLHDVTERSQLEQQLHQAQKMEAIGRLAGGIAHDFNNLLTVIGGYSEMLLSNELNPDASRGLIQEIKKAGERATSLTRQLLAFSRQQVLTPKILDLNLVVTDTERMLRRLIGEDILLTLNLDPALGRVKADAGQLEQILMNLAVNARDAMPQGGKIDFETRNVDLDWKPPTAPQEFVPGRYVLLTVSDTGCGMSDTVKARLFEPFFTTKPSGKGTGLGLATVYGIVRQSGGHIEVESAPNRGATFRIYFPRIGDSIVQKSTSTDAGAVPRGAETLLLVEDEAGVRMLASHVLQRCGYHVLEASEGKQALNICEEFAGTIHLVVTDVVMPDLGGHQLAERLSKLRPEIKVLFVSGYTDDSVLRHGVREAEVAFLQKPFTVASLARKVREVLDQ